MMWYEILTLFVFLGCLVANALIKFYNTIVEVYSNEQEKK